MSAETSIRLSGPITPTSAVVMVAPSMAPMVPPTATTPKRRLPWPGRNTSVSSDQNTDTTNRLKMLVQMKNTRPTQMAWVVSTALKTR